MRACWLKWVGRDWSISADYIWLNYSDANNAVAISGATQDFDLTKGPEQSHQIKLKDGTVAVIGIKKPMNPA